MHVNWTKWELIFALILCVFFGLAIGLENPKPKVIPSIREWNSGFGSLAIGSNSRICLDDKYQIQLVDIASVFQKELLEITGQDLQIVSSGCPRTHDIHLSLDIDDPTIGAEGYVVHTGSYSSIRAHEGTGVFYGTRTLLQLLKQDEAHIHLPRGTIRDYPQWEIRGFMLDTGRMYFPIEVLKDYVRFMGWYKMNEFHLHLNDNQIGPTNLDDYAAFRLASNAFPGLEADDGAYSMEEWQDLEQLAGIYGVNILPEIDSPAHSLAFTAYRPDLIYSMDRLDLLNLEDPEAIHFMMEVWADFLPHFRSSEVHIGGDEYPHEDAAAYKRYVNQLNQQMIAAGKSTRLWGSLDRMGGGAGVDKGIVIDIWKLSAYMPDQAIEDGFDIVNVLDDNLYIVPLAGVYHDYLDTEWIYRDWQPDYFTDSPMIQSGDMQHVLGGKFALWNDRLGLGYTQYDVYDRVRPAMQAMSQKLWNPRLDLEYLDYVYLCQLIGDAPGTQLRFTPPADEGNLALHARVWVSSIEHGTPYYGENLVDGSMQTRWASDSTDETHFSIDLGKIQPAIKVVLIWEESYAGAYKLQLSTNGSIWSDVAVVGDGKGGEEVIEFTPRNARYIRLILNESSSDYGFSLWEIRVY